MPNENPPEWVRQLLENPAAFREQLLREQPELKQAIQSRINHLLDLARTYDPLPLVVPIAVRNSMFDTVGHLSGIDESSIVRTEYALSIALSVPDSQRPEPAADVIEEFGRVVTEVLDLTSQYFVTDAMDLSKYTLAAAELRQALLTYRLNVRGESRLQHQFALVRALFTPHDDFLREKTGYGTEEYISFIREADRQLIETITTYDEVRKRQAALAAELRRRGTDNPDFEAGVALPADLVPEADAIGALIATLPSSPFEIIPNDRAPAALMDHLAARFGDNAAFATIPPKAPAWPTNDSVIYERPLLERDGKYYAFLPSPLVQRLAEIFEALIRRHDETYFTDTYTEKRGKLLERLALQQLVRLLPGASTYQSVYYTTADGKRCESDGLVIYGRTLLVTEMKAGAVSPVTRRGGIDAIRKDVKALIADAHEQATRVREYIRGSATARFEYRVGTEAVTINTADIDDIITVNVTLSHLGILATKLNTVAGLNVLQDRIWPWTVFINDLQIVADVLEGPAEFLAYIKRRIAVNDLAAVTTVDENDLLMAFLVDGLEFTEAKEKNVGLVLLDNFTLPLDAYYLAQDGYGSAAKPVLSVPESIRRLTRGLEAHGPEGTAVATDLLLLPRGNLIDLGLQLDTMEANVRANGTSHDLTLPTALPYGLTIAIGRSDAEEWVRKVRMMVELRKYHHKAERWVVIGIVISPDGTATYEPLAVVGPWLHNDRLHAAATQQFGTATA